MYRIVFKEGSIWDGPWYEIQQYKPCFFGLYSRWKGVHLFYRKADAFLVLENLKKQLRDGEIVYSD